MLTLLQQDCEAQLTGSNLSCGMFCFNSLLSSHFTTSAYGLWNTWYCVGNAKRHEGCNNILESWPRWCLVLAVIMMLPHQFKGQVMGLNCRKWKVDDGDDDCLRDIVQTTSCWWNAGFKCAGWGKRILGLHLIIQQNLLVVYSMHGKFISTPTNKNKYKRRALQWAAIIIYNTFNTTNMVFSSVTLHYLLPNCKASLTTFYYLMCRTFIYLSYRWWFWWSHPHVPWWCWNQVRV